MRKRSLLFCLALFVCSHAHAGESLGAAALDQSVKDVACPLRLLCIAAHPDDEDGATLALYRKQYGVKTFALIATRGEGGQNEIGPELYEELGAIRTREMMEAAAIEGAELHFLDMPEFGFSKSIEETFERWGHEETRARLVRVLRTLRPHIIITHHGLQKDHGHHQAIGAVAQEAFHLAADPAAFPQQIAAGLAPWQAARLYVRVWTPEPGAVLVPLNTLDPVRGRTYAQIAAHALEVHRSQGMKFFIDRLLSGDAVAHYRLVLDSEAGSETSAALRPLDHRFGPLFAGLRLPEGPWRAAPKPHEAAKLRRALIKATKTDADTAEEARRALAVQAALDLDVKPSVSAAIPGQNFEIVASVRDFGAPDTQRLHLTLEAPDGVMGAPLQLENGAASHRFAVTVPRDQPQTLPHAAALGTGSLLVPQWRVRAESVDPALPLAIEKPVYVEIAPPVLAQALDAPLLLRLPAAAASLSCRVRLRHFAPTATEYRPELQLPPKWRGSIAPELVRLAEPGEERMVTITLTPPADTPAGLYDAAVRVGGSVAPLQVHAVALEAPRHARIGLIRSYDDVLEQTLARLAVPFTLLGDRDFTPEALDACTTIVVDMRAYAYRPDLVANNQALLDFAQRGGHLVVMYHKTFDWRPAFAPYSITLSNNRVTREDAPIQLLQPEHPFFTTPNRIAPSDWDGWIQERGLYFAGQWDTRYTPLIACNDPGETIPPGSWLTTATGRGHYTYTALVWYRQLRELHPGALRLFANLIALARAS